MKNITDTTIKYLKLGYKFVLAFVLIASALLSVSHSTFANSGASLSISPATQNVTNGDNVSFNIVINTDGNSVNAVQSVFTYPSEFSLVSIGPGSSFGEFPYTTSGSSILFTAGSTSPVNGTVSAAVVTLHATTNGPGTLSLAGVCGTGDYSDDCSAAYDASTSENDLSSASGASYTVVSPTCPSGYTGTYPNCVAPSSGSGSSGGGGSGSAPVNSSKQGSPAAGTSSNTKSSPSSASTPSTSTTTPTTPSTTTTPTVPAVSSSSSPTGAVVITVTNSQGQPVDDAEVTISPGNYSTHTNSRGIAGFSSIAIGNYKVTVKSPGKQSTTKEMQLIPGQQKQLTFKLANGTSSIQLGIVLAFGFLVIILFAFRYHFLRGGRLHLHPNKLQGSAAIVANGKAATPPSDTADVSGDKPVVISPEYTETDNSSQSNNPKVLAPPPNEETGGSSKDSLVSDPENSHITLAELETKIGSKKKN